MNTTVNHYHHGHLAEALLNRAAEVIDEQGIEALTLRGLARDLGVSHSAPNRHFKNKAALLSALAAKGWFEARDAVLGAAAAVAGENALVRLHAMGRGYLTWALEHRALFRAIYHPDVSRRASSELKGAIRQFAAELSEAIEATQAEGRHPGVPLPVLTIFTNAVPTGAAVLLLDAFLGEEMTAGMDRTDLIEQVIDLVVPLPDRGASE